MPLATIEYILPLGREKVINPVISVHGYDGLRLKIGIDSSDHSVIPILHLYWDAASLRMTFTESDFVNLGRLKANIGNQNYPISAGTDMTKYDTVLIWCRAFSVLFGSADLK